MRGGGCARRAAVWLQLALGPAAGPELRATVRLMRAAFRAVGRRPGGLAWGPPPWKRRRPEAHIIARRPESREKLLGSAITRSSALGWGRRGSKGLAARGACGGGRRGAQRAGVGEGRRAGRPQGRTARCGVCTRPGRQRTTSTCRGAPGRWWPARRPPSAASPAPHAHTSRGVGACRSSRVWPRPRRALVGRGRAPFWFVGV
jgi:hypothetical protein